MSVQQLTVNQKTNACNGLKQAINQLSQDVSEDVYCRQVEEANYSVINILKKALFTLNGTTVKSDVIGYIKRAVQRLSVAVDEEVDQEAVENANDDAVDSLNAALNRLGYYRWEK